MDQDIIDFNNWVDAEYKTYLNNIKQTVMKLFRDAIYSEVYQAYTPVPGGYNRTNQLLDNIGVEFDSLGNLLVYTAPIHYYSEVDGRDVTSAVPWFIQGHSDGIGIDAPGQNQYHIYQERDYLGEAQRLIQNAFPSLKVTIINDAPPKV